MADWSLKHKGPCACRFVRHAEFGEVQQVEWCGKHAKERDEINALRKFHDFFHDKCEGLFAFFGIPAVDRYNEASSIRMASGSPTEKTKSSDFIAGVVYSAAQIIQAHGCTRAAEDLLNGVVKPIDDLKDCAEYDLQVLRENIPAWQDVPRGI